jgi:methionine-rich copper-binding protein CopC
MTAKTWLIPILLAASTAAGPPAPDSVGVFHLELEKSEPVDGTSVAAVSDVCLWFTQTPQDGTTSIRVLDEAGEPVATGEVVQDEEDGSLFSVSVPDALPEGPYTVVWRAMGADGHVVRGEVSFTVTAP